MYAPLLLDTVTVFGGQPHDGQLAAGSATCVEHSGHLMRATDSPFHPKQYKIVPMCMVA